jgi:RNA polymerase sigma factor (sigma-70 family)
MTSSTSGDSFPLTRHSVLDEVRSADPQRRQRAWDALVGAYWRPVYKYVRLRWRAEPEDAEDLTQGFFTRALEKSFFDSFDPARSRFRTFLRTTLDRYVGHEKRDRARMKRGGGVSAVSLDFASAEGELGPEPPATDEALEAFFHREWLRGVFQEALQELEAHATAQGRALAFTLFHRYDIEEPEAETRSTYAELARELGIPATQVTNHLAWARRELRRLLLARLAACTASREEYEMAVRDLVGRP